MGQPQQHYGKSGLGPHDGHHAKRGSDVIALETQDAEVLKGNVAGVFAEAMGDDAVAEDSGGEEAELYPHTSSATSFSLTFHRLWTWKEKEGGGGEGD